MAKLSPAGWLLLPAGIALYFLYFFGLSRTGLLGPDEPRYAAIGLQMARSLDWITPRLWGRPWFEKPPFLYWTTAAGFRAGLGAELAPRLPVAILSVAFLVFFWMELRDKWGPSAASFATCVLATCGGWLVYSRTAVTDLPLAALFSGAMLLLLRPEWNRAILAGILLGVAVLAKGLVPLVLFLPAIWFLRRRLRTVGLIVLLACLVAAPWYVWVTLRNGRAFLLEFFWNQQAARFFTSRLEHVQPFWFYIPVLLAALFPWSPLLVTIFNRRVFSNERERFLLAWALWGFIFFSLSRNKLPGYLIPLLPAFAALIGIQLAHAARGLWPLAASALLLFLIPAIAAALPQVLQAGLSRSGWRLQYWPVAPALLIAAAIMWLDKHGWRSAAVACIAVAMTAGAVYIVWTDFPILDRTVSARSFWHDRDPAQPPPCSSNSNRGWRYSLNYYTQREVPDCR